jgi:hypothetical protein
MRKFTFAAAAALLASSSLVQAAPCDPAVLFKNLKPATFIAAIKACEAADIAAAIAVAEAAPPDALALACLQPLQAIVNSQQQGGLLTAFESLSRAKQSGFLPACQAWVNSVVLP